MGLLFWDRVNKLAKMSKTKQEWIAEAAGVKFQTLRSWVTKDILPRVDDGVKIAGSLGVTAEYLLGGAEKDGVEAEAFYASYRKYAALLGYVEGLSPEQREDLEDAARVWSEKRRGGLCKVSSI
jgi:transcriptional regulator with XRE-family HTH domain